MNVLDQIMNWLGLASANGTRRESSPIHELLEAGQRAKRAEDYDTALEALNRAAHLAETTRNINALAVITLNRAEIEIYKGHHTEAEQRLLTLRHTAQNTGQRTQMAYTLSMLGVLAQTRDNWVEARGFYEQALKVGRATGSPGPAGRAMGHLADTYLEENNASYALHLLREALPKLNTSGDIELSSYFVAQLGRASILSGHEIEGERLLHRALRLAEQMHHRRYERLCALLLGERALAGLRYNDAQAHFKQALALMDMTAPTQETITALCHMSKISLHLQETGDALLFAQQAVEASEKLDDFKLATMAQGALGIALRAGGQSAVAINHLQKAAENYREIGQPESSGIPIEILRNLGAAKADADDDDSAIDTYQHALKAAQASENSLELAQTHLELALVYARRKQMQAAIQEWMAALPIYESHRYFAQVARLRCDIGGARKFLGQGQRAMKEYEQALTILSSVDDQATRGIVLSNAANIYADYGDVDSADAFFSESISIASRLGDRAAEATRRGNYGWFLLSTGRPQPALSTLEHAILISNEQNLDLQVAVQTDNLGLAHNLLGNQAAALAYHEQALEMVSDLDDSHWKAIIQINLANTLLGVSRTDEADLLLDEALQVGQAEQDIEVIVRALTGRAKVALLYNQTEAAGEMLDQAITQARRSDMRRLLAEALRIYSEQQAAANQPEQSQALWDEAKKLFNILHTPSANLQPQWLSGVSRE